MIGITLERLVDPLHSLGMTAALMRDDAKEMEAVEMFGMQARTWL